MIGSPQRRPPTRRAWWQAPTRWSPTTAFPNSYGRSAWRRAHAASPWYSTPTGRRRCPMSCSASPRMWCSPASVCAPPPASTTSAPRSPPLPRRPHLFSPSPRARGDVLWREGATLRQSPVFAVEAIDTLGAGDVFHGAFALALAAGRDVVAALRFAAAATGLKCTRLGGSMAAPRRAEVEALLAAS